MDDPVSWLRVQVGEDEQELARSVGEIELRLVSRLRGELEVKLRLLAEHELYDTGAGACCSTCSDVDQSGQARGDWPCATLRALIWFYYRAGRDGCRPEWRAG